MTVTRFAVALCLACMVLPFAMPASSLSLPLGSGIQQIGPYAGLYHARDNELSANALRTAPFVPVDNKFVTFRHHAGTYWLRFSINSTDNVDTQRIISFDYPHVYNAVLYRELATGLEQVANHSAALPLRDKQVRHRYPALLFHVPRKSDTTYYLQLELQGKANQALEYELRLYPAGEFIGQQSAITAPLIAFVGFMLSLLIYNLILYTRVGIRGYLYYSLYLIAQVVGLMAFEGFFYLLPLPVSVSTVVLLMTISPILCGIFLIQFGRDILDLKDNMPRANRALLLATILLFAMMLLAAAGASWINLPMEVLGLLTIVAMAMIAIVIYRRGSKAALYFSISFAFLFVGYSAELVLYSIPTMSAEGGLLSGAVLQWMERYFYYSCAAVEMVFLALALAAYIVQIRDEKEQAQQESIHNLQERQRIQSQYATQLEQDIDKRTAEISKQSELLADQADKLREMDNLKSRFYANLSHEFRTPLTLISGPIQDVLAGEHGSLDDAAVGAMEVAERNAERLARLIDELLMLAELESGSLSLQSEQQDMCGFCRRAVSLFTHTAVERNISLEVSAPSDELPVYIDVQKFEKVLCNLLSNAFKYTPDGGHVRLSVRVRGEELNKSTGDFVEIEVSDSGIGIAGEDQAHVFERFYRSETGAETVVEGSGIGLALVKELVELHGGDIHLVSSVRTDEGADGGSSFVVVLPLGHAHLDEDEIRVDVVHAATPATRDSPASNLVADSAQSTVLVVEDNSDMRSFVVSRLQADYRVLEASHGKQALELLQQASVDLILSDVMMPQMDGIALLEHVRAEPSWRHLPVVLLTARSSDEHKLHALRAQADDFLAKPFRDEELRLKIANLLRRGQQAAVSVPVITSSRMAEAPLDSAERKFLQKAEEVVRAHLAETDFDVAALAEALHMSRSTLQRRLDKAAGITPAEFIRQLRLEQAHRYVMSGHFRTLAETAYAVGFNQAGYFARLYRKFAADLPGSV